MNTEWWKVKDNCLSMNLRLESENIDAMKVAECIQVPSEVKMPKLWNKELKDQRHQKFFTLTPHYLNSFYTTVLQLIFSPQEGKLLGLVVPILSGWDIPQEYIIFMLLFDYETPKSWIPWEVSINYENPSLLLRATIYQCSWWFTRLKEQIDYPDKERRGINSDIKTFKFCTTVKLEVEWRKCLKMKKFWKNRKTIWKTNAEALNIFKGYTRFLH